MSVRSVWQKRALANLTALPELDSTDLQIDERGELLSFKPLSYEQIRERLADHVKMRMPFFSQAVDDPTSTVGGLIDAVAAADADLFRQAEALLETFTKAKKT